MVGTVKSYNAEKGSLIGRMRAHADSKSASALSEAGASSQVLRWWRCTARQASCGKNEQHRALKDVFFMKSSVVGGVIERNQLDTSESLDRKSGGCQAHGDSGASFLYCGVRDKGHAGAHTPTIPGA